MNPAIGQLVSKSRRSLAAADALTARGDHDFAVSRAYYAMFYLAEAALLAQGLSYSKHSAVIGAFGRELVKGGGLSADLHASLRSAFDARSLGDYGASPVIERDAAGRVLTDARTFAQAVEPTLRKHLSPLRLGVLISGGGRTLINMHEQIQQGRLDAEIAVVICSRAQVKGVQLTQELGLPLEVIRIKDHPDTDSFSEAITRTLEKAEVDLACLAGWMCFWKIPERWMGRVMNIHPALLPKYGGKGFFGHHVHEAVLKAGQTESGCTVHFANNEYDAGPIILQRKVPVLPGDDADALAARVFEQECIAYPEAIRLFAEGRIALQGDQVIRT